MPRPTPLTLLALLVTVALAAVAGPAAAGPGDDERRPSAAAVAKVRKATAPFRDVEKAIAAGYVAAPTCDADPERGGMGFHYLHPGRIADGRLVATRPEFLLYEPTRGGGRRLVGVEYYDEDADQDKATSDELRPVLGHQLDAPMDGHFKGMPIHRDLHVWLYKANPDGMFAQYNPKVRC